MSTNRRYAGVAALGSELYVIAGENADGGTRQPLSTNEKYDPDTDTWAMISSFSSVRGMNYVAPLNGKIYSVGGYNIWGSPVPSPCPCSDGTGNDLIYDSYSYDPATDQWSSAAFFTKDQQQKRIVFLTASTLPPSHPPASPPLPPMTPPPSAPPPLMTDPQ